MCCSAEVWVIAGIGGSSKGETLNVYFSWQERDRCIYPDRERAKVNDLDKEGSKVKSRLQTAYSS
jgi:hypothetical protein